jgi:O-6-methylguanine DNA methyltransferase
MQNNFQKSFKERVLEVIRKIPEGETLSYKEVSLRAGVAGAARAVGTVCRNNADKSVPCHRVIRSGGEVGEYNGLRSGQKGSKSKADLLAREALLKNTKQ